MRALLVYPEFPLSFWTFRQACRFGGRKALAPPLGLITVAALLPRDWELRLTDLNTRGFTEDDWNWADVVMISAMFAQREGCLAVVREAKRRGRTTVAGGPYPSSLPAEVLNEGCDFVVRGEGETSVPRLLEALEKGESSGIFDCEKKPNLKDSPMPRFDLLHFNDYNVLCIQTSRGCPFDCEFCDVVHLYGHETRYKSPEQVIEELEALHRMGGWGRVFICDDNFIGNRKRARAILHELTPWQESRGHPFGFITQASLDLGQDLDMIDMMTAANFSEVFVGIESPDEDALGCVRKTPNVRNPLVESLNNIVENGLTVFGSFIIGLDGERRGVGGRICDLVDKTGIPVVMLNTLQVIPNTKLWRRLEGEGRLLGMWNQGEATFSNLNYIPSRPESEIMNEYVEAWRHLYEPTRYIGRAYRYHLTMRPTRRALAKQRGDAAPSDRPKRPPLRNLFFDLMVFLHLAWRQGVYRRFRFLFWGQLIKIWRRNPSRINRYLTSCVMGEDLFRIRDLVRERKRTNFTGGEPER